MLFNAKQKLNAITFDENKKQNKFGSNEERTLAGYLGEQLVLSHLQTAVHSDTFEYDLLYKNKKIEVKTISCGFKPKLDYLCVVNSCKDDGVRKQLADYYIFTRVKNCLTVGWILGYIKCHDFFKQGTFVPKGSEPISGIVFSKANATVLPISLLTLMKGDNAEWVKEYEREEQRLK